jgi:hypothetical protein
MATSFANRIACQPRHIRQLAPEAHENQAAKCQQQIASLESNNRANRKYVSFQV